jgi:hypothetical protein
MARKPITLEDCARSPSALRGPGTSAASPSQLGCSQRTVMVARVTLDAPRADHALAPEELRLELARARPYRSMGLSAHRALALTAPKTTPSEAPGSDGSRSMPGSIGLGDPPSPPSTTHRQGWRADRIPSESQGAEGSVLR